MTKKSNETKTISLSLNFNNENHYHFTVNIPPKTNMDEVWDLTGVNSIGEKFYLEGLGKALMWLLLQLDHATKKSQSASFNPAYWRIHSARKKRRIVALFADVPAVKKVDRSAEVSVPADCVALPETNVIQVEFSPEAK
jgi:hypothetical protein